MSTKKMAAKPAKTAKPTIKQAEVPQLKCEVAEVFGDEGADVLFDECDEDDELILDIVAAIRRWAKRVGHELPRATLDE